jgi:hypothetical protein
MLVPGTCAGDICVAEPKEVSVKQEERCHGSIDNRREWIVSSGITFIVISICA